MVAADFDIAVKQAHDAYARNQINAQRALKELRSIQPPPMPEAERNNHLIKAAQNMPFNVKTAYHNWSRSPKFTTSSDYIIQLSYLNNQHPKKLQKQYSTWISQGFFIERAEAQPQSKGMPYATILWVRIVK